MLTPKQIQALVETATRVVERFKGHVDIEWAIEAGILYLLQVRPITRSKEAKPYALWTRDNVADVIPDAVTPLTWSVVKGATREGFASAIRALGLRLDDCELFQLFDGKGSIPTRPCTRPFLIPGRLAKQSACAAGRGQCGQTRPLARITHATVQPFCFWYIKEFAQHFETISGKGQHEALVN